MRGVRRPLAAVPLLVASALAAQEPVTPAEAQRLEEAGRYEEAARAYGTALDGAPADVELLTGLYRSLDRLGRLAEIAPYLTRAVHTRPAEEALRELEFRALADAFGGDSAAAAFRRWAAAFPRSGRPYQQQAFWLARNGDLRGANEVLAQGQERLGTPALAQYAGQLLVAAGDWEAAARQWRTAVSANDALVNSAGAALAQAPVVYHDPILRLLRGRGALPLPLPDSALPALWLAADLLARWDRAAEGWTLLELTLPADGRRATLLVRRFGERARLSRGAGGRRARGAALEWLAERAPPQDAGRLRLEAAQAYGEAGDLQAAQRLLDRAGGLPADRPGEAARTMAALIGVLADAGQLDEAEERFDEWASRLRGDDLERLREKLAWARVVAGDLERATSLLGEDSSVAALAVRGWIALYQGELAAARRLLREAGPNVRGVGAGETGGVGGASRRARLLVLLERVQAERLPALGEGLLAAHRGDTARALDRLGAAADQLPSTGGRADVLVAAAELALDAADFQQAETLLDRSLAADSAGPAAPGALYRLAEVHLAQGRVEAAVAELERLILTFPASAMVPSGRRLLDRARNRIPTP